MKDGPHAADRAAHAADRAAAALAAGQHGVVSGAQLIALGLSQQAIQRRCAAGWLHRLHRGVYAIGHVALTPRSREIAAVLAHGPEAVLSHRSAARLWGLARHAPALEVTAPRSRAPRDGITLHRSRHVDPSDRASLDAIPVTALARTLVDLADVLSERQLADAVHEAEVRRLFDLPALEQALARVPGRAGRHRLWRVLALHDVAPAITRSEAEARLLDLCLLHGLPTPRANATIGGYEVDFLWPQTGLVVEVDGAAAHYTRRAFHADRQRDRDLATLGIQVVRVTWRDLVDDPVRLAGQLATVLARRRDALRA